MVDKNDVCFLKTILKRTDKFMCFGYDGVGVLSTFGIAYV